jgi:hypothetical protein
VSSHGLSSTTKNILLLKSGKKIRKTGTLVSSHGLWLEDRQRKFMHMGVTTDEEEQECRSSRNFMPWGWDK